VRPACRLPPTQNTCELSALVRVHELSAWRLRFVLGWTLADGKVRAREEEGHYPWQGLPGAIFRICVWQGLQVRLLLWGCVRSKL